MVITITLTPEIERQLVVSELRTGEENSVRKSTKTFVGAGLNASKIIKAFGGETTAIGFIAGQNGRFIKDGLGLLQIEHDFTEVPGQVAVNTKIIPENGRSTYIREPSFVVSYDDYHRLRDKALKYANNDAIFIIGGNIPQYMNLSMYCALCRDLSDAGARILISAPTDIIKEAVPSGPVTVCFTARQLTDFSGLAPTDDSRELYIAALSVMERGAASVTVSLGNEGLLYCSQLYAAQISAPGENDYDKIISSEVYIPVFACALARGMENDIAACYAAAASVACQNTGKTVASISEVTYLFGAMELNQLCSVSDLSAPVVAERSVKFE